MRSFFKKLYADWVFWLAFGLIVYMPLHVLIVQSLSLMTGGIDVWKAAKDVLIFLLLPILLAKAYKQGLFKDKSARYLLFLGAAYGLLHGLFLVFDTQDDTGSALVASVYNTRLLIYLLIGMLIGTSKKFIAYRKYLLTAALAISLVVALFGIAQYFLPKDMLTHVGYSLERGVKPMFFIDDKPDLPRIMSTIKDPNSLGAYLILPILICFLALIKKSAIDELFLRPFRREVMVGFIAVLLAALLFSFSRGALLGLFLSVLAILSIVKGQWVFSVLSRFKFFVGAGVILFIGLGFMLKDSYVFQNYVFHADQSTVLADPNELRVQLLKKSITAIANDPLGHGPGTAGLIAITNPKSGVLTENYFLQIAHEVGILGALIFTAILLILAVNLVRGARERDELSVVLLSALVAYVFYGLLIHLWSNEAVALQWWLLTGVVVAKQKPHVKKRTRR